MGTFGAVVLYGPKKFTQHMDNCYDAFASLENFFCKPLELLYSRGSVFVTKQH